MGFVPDLCEPRVVGPSFHFGPEHSASSLWIASKDVPPISARGMLVGSLGQFSKFCYPFGVATEYGTLEKGP